jgi:hypothetical protein
MGQKHFLVHMHPNLIFGMKDNIFALFICFSCIHTVPLLYLLYVIVHFHGVILSLVIYDFHLNYPFYQQVNEGVKGLKPYTISNNEN